MAEPAKVEMPMTLEEAPAPNEPVTDYLQQSQLTASQLSTSQVRDRSNEKIYSKIKLRTSSNGSDRRMPIVDVPTSPKDEIAAAL